MRARSHVLMRTRSEAPTRPCSYVPMRSCAHAFMCPCVRSRMHACVHVYMQSHPVELTTSAVAVQPRKWMFEIVVPAMAAMTAVVDGIFAQSNNVIVVTDR
eukprot:364869-Chlamydomonas_euryale.AAC.20